MVLTANVSQGVQHDKHNRAELLQLLSNLCAYARLKVFSDCPCAEKNRAVMIDMRSQQSREMKFYRPRSNEPAEFS